VARWRLVVSLMSLAGPSTDQRYRKSAAPRAAPDLLADAAPPAGRLRVPPELPGPA